MQALDAGVHAQGKKLIEEAGEVWLAAEHEDDDSLALEISQLLYRAQVIMIGRGITLEQVYRTGILADPRDARDRVTTGPRWHSGMPPGAQRRALNQKAQQC